MVRSEVFPVDIDLQPILAKPVEASLEQATVGPYHDQAGAALAPGPQAEQQSGEWKNVVRRVVTAATFAGALLLSGGRPAEAASSAVPAEAPPQGSGFDWDIATGFGLALTAYALYNQTREKTRDRFYQALQEIKGESTGEERLARLNAVEPFVERRGYALAVFKTSTAYLKGRRGSLLKLKRGHKDKPEELEDSITDRRNADRKAFEFILATLPRVRRQMHRRALAKRTARCLKITYWEEDELELEEIDELTDLQVDADKPLVNARAIYLDDMRGDVQSCNFRDVDLTGSGLQRNEIKRVSFRRASLRQVQLEGSRLSHCNLKGTDLRAAYFGDTDFTIIEKCIIDADTQFGNLPDNHPDAFLGMLDPARADEYRGIPNVILRDLRSRTLSKKQIKELVWSWQKNGLVLQPGSTPEYFLNPSDASGDPATPPTL